MRRIFSWSSLLVGLTLAVGCSDEGGGDGQSSRSTLLDQVANQIAADGLSDKPSQSFVLARSRVERNVSKPNTDYARTYMLSRGGASLAGDVGFARVRGEAAKALGTTLDPNREADAASAQRGLDALLTEVKKKVPTAASCEDLGDRALDCVIALLVIEVQRSEAPPVTADAGVPDAGNDAAVDSGAPQANVTPIECADRDPTGAMEVTTRVTADATWSGKVLIKGAIQVQSAKLTITPGTTILMDVDSSLDIGYLGSSVGLFANGTPEAPIRICGKVATAGYWKGLAVRSTVTSDSFLRNVLIADGGGTDASAKLEAAITVDNLQVRNAAKDGVWATDFKPDSKQLTVDGSGGSPIVLIAEGALTHLPLGGSLRSNTDNVVRIRFTDMYASGTVHRLAIPYLQESRLNVRNASDLTFEAGVEYRVGTDATLTIGYLGGAASIHANGTAAAPIVFRSASDTTRWGGISIESSIASTANLTYTEIRQAGSRVHALDVKAPVLIENLTLSQNALGMQVSAKGLTAGSKNLTITGTTGRPLDVEPDALFTLPSGSSFSGNSPDQIGVLGSDMYTGGTIPNLGIPYAITATTFNIRGKTGTNAVRIDPGVQFLMVSGAVINVGYLAGSSAPVSLVAAGTAAQPIVFRGATETAGFWKGIVVTSGVLADSRLEYVQIGHAGASDPAAALTLSSGIAVTNSRFYDSAGWGIYRNAGVATDYLPTNTFERCALGNVGPAAAAK